MNYVNAREGILTDYVKEAQLAMWSSYCDMKMSLEDANDRIFALENALSLLLQEHDLYLLEGGPSSEAWDNAKALLEQTDE